MIDFTKGLNFSGLIIKDNAGESRTIDQVGEGSKKKIFLSFFRMGFRNKFSNFQ